MFYVGIDVSKKSSEICVINQKKEIVKQFKLIHSNDGFKKFFKIIRKIDKNKNNFEFAIFSNHLINLLKLISKML